MQTLIQLLPIQKQGALVLPGVAIEDYPRFGYRGAMLDVSRHFFDVNFIIHNHIIARGDSIIMRSEDASHSNEPATYNLYPSYLCV